LTSHALTNQHGNFPAIVEVMLNPDGWLWIDRLSSGLADTGERPLRRSRSGSPPSRSSRSLSLEPLPRLGQLGRDARPDNFAVTGAGRPDDNERAKLKKRCSVGLSLPGKPTAIHGNMPSSGRIKPYDARATCIVTPKPR